MSRARGRARKGKGRQASWRPKVPTRAERLAVMALEIDCECGHRFPVCGSKFPAEVFELDVGLAILSCCPKCSGANHSMLVEHEHFGEAQSMMQEWAQEVRAETGEVPKIRTRQCATAEDEVPVGPLH